MSSHRRECINEQLAQVWGPHEQSTGYESSERKNPNGSEEMLRLRSIDLKKDDIRQHKQQRSTTLENMFEANPTNSTGVRKSGGGNGIKYLHPNEINA